jgi:hypothetical protein
MSTLSNENTTRINMKKQLVIIGIVTLLVSVGLSGCNESQSLGDTVKVQLLDYTVETYGWDFGYQYKKIGNGFINDVYDQGEYIIKGTIKNSAGEMLNTINIKLNFYDENNVFLVYTTKILHNLPDTYVQDFEVKLTNNAQYYYNIDHVEFQFTVT